MLDHLPADWPGYAGCLLLIGLLGWHRLTLWRRERRAARPRVHLLGSAATHPLPHVNRRWCRDVITGVFQPMEDEE
jgi:hypothetical protein